MHKRIINPDQQDAVVPDDTWLNLDGLAEVEITSEDPTHPIEYALLPGQASGWRAGGTGKQTIRLLFTDPQHIKRIYLQFEERRAERTQEYVLRWSPDGGRTFHEIVRQQWNFSPAGATAEAEDYQVDLAAVTVLELSIVPDISGRPIAASLHQLRLA